MSTKHDVIARFIHVIKPLGEIYRLPPTSLHIFYDQGGEMIAFNRNASIFLNLRYFEAWRESSFSLYGFRGQLVNILHRRPGCSYGQLIIGIHFMVQAFSLFLKPIDLT
jgi:hypothetical protein